jgi:hypothetical protein
MSETDDITARLQARAAYLGYRDKTPTADLLPTRTMPAGLQDPDCHDVVGYLVALVRDTYVRCRRNSREIATRRPDRYGHFRLEQWDGGYDWRGQYHVPIWVKIARAILDRGLDVKGFVTWQFARAETAGSPYPNKLLSPTALDSYEREEQREVIWQRQLSIKIMTVQLELEINRYRGMFSRSPGEAAIAAFRNPTIALSAFFRYLIVSNYCRTHAEDEQQPARVQEILRMFRRGALREYTCSAQAYETACDQLALSEFQAVFTLVRIALAELVDGDQGQWPPPPGETMADTRRPGTRKSEG